MADPEDRAQPKREQGVPADEDARQLRAIADAVPALIAYVDADRRYRFNNQAYARWFGRTPQELNGVHIAGLLGDGAYEAVREEIDRVLAGETVSYEKLVPYERGSRWTNTVFVPDIDKQGRVAGFVALVTDVTERKQAEEHVRRVHEQLEIADRLASVGTLAMGVAHEVNNPLAIIIANQDYALTALARLKSQCTEPGDGPSETDDRIAAGLAALEETLRDARQAADRVRRIVRDLEVFASPDTDRRAHVDVQRVLAAAIGAFGNDIPPHARLIETYGRIGLVLGNDALLGQVFLHLLRNAVQAVSERTHFDNEIRVTTREDAEGNVVVEVADTGCGIAPEHLGRIFDPFFTTRPVGRGTGLGLWVSARIVTGMGGTIEVDSQVGEGTTFTVTLPALAARP